MADKNFNTVTVSGSIGSSDYLHATIGGTHNRVLVSTLIAKAKAETLTEVEANLLDKITDGCFIMYHRAVESTDNYPIARNASAWVTRQNAGEIADGVLVVCGDKHIVVAPTGSGTVHWGSNNTLVASTNNYSTDREWAMSHFDGKARTAAIISSTAYSGDGADYAPGFCAAYSRANKNGQGLTAGKWWLPSAGELAMILANKQKINACLALITGAQQLVESGHWSSSERMATTAWYLNLSYSYLEAGTKDSFLCYVRPVSAFIK